MRSPIAAATSLTKQVDPYQHHWTHRDRPCMAAADSQLEIPVLAAWSAIPVSDELSQSAPHEMCCHLQGCSTIERARGECHTWPIGQFMNMKWCTTHDRHGLCLAAESSSMAWSILRTEVIWIFYRLYGIDEAEPKLSLTIVAEMLRKFSSGHRKAHKPL